MNTFYNSSSTNGSSLLYYYDESEAIFEFVIHGLLISFIGFVGIIGNVISVIILSRPQMKSSINYLLKGLCVCDTVLIITSIFLFGLPGIYQYTETHVLFTYQFRIFPFISVFLYPVAMISQTVSVYLTLTVTLERFVAVCHPLQARSLCTLGRARYYVILTITLSVIYNIPRFLEVEVYKVHEDYNTTLYSDRPSEIRNNKIYISLYIHWLYLVFMYFLPFSFLAVLNLAIYQQIRRANQERQRISSLQKKEIGLATMLLCVVVTFMMCNFVPLVTNVLECFYELDDRLAKIGNLLVTFNSSINFVIYVIFGEKFKRLFLKMFFTHGVYFCGSALGGRDSPEGGTHEDSLISNGDSCHYSVRGTHLCQIHRPGTTIVRNGRSGTGKKFHRTLSPGPCVYYPARSPVSAVDKWDETTTTTSDNQL